MRDFNEDNFFEAIMPLLKEIPIVDRCPDAETFIAVVQGTASAALQHAVAVHMAECSSCSHLRERLLNFDGPDQPEFGGEWAETEDRLDFWLRHVLEREGPSGQVGGRLSSHPNRWWTKLAQGPFSWRVGWALAVTAAAGVMVSIYIVRPGAKSLPRQNSASVTFPTQAPTIPNTESSARNGDTAVQEPPTTGQEVGNQPPATNRADGPTESAPSPSPVSGTTESGRPTAPAITSATSQSIPDKPGSSSLAQASPLTPNEPTAVTAQVSPKKDNDAAQPAASVPPSHAEATDRPEVPSLAQPRPSHIAEPPTSSGVRAPLPNKAVSPGAVYQSRVGTTSVSAGRITAYGAAPRASAGASAQVRPPRPSPPSLIRIESGTRVWIRLKSISRTTNGEFEFQGNVLLPVTQAGLILLDRNTEVNGTGKASQDRTSLRITEIVSSDGSYRLKDGGGALNMQASGAGGAVRFDSGHVYELWLGLASTYERIVREAGEPKR